jgi:hypothetical protein
MIDQSGSYCGENHIFYFADNSTSSKVPEGFPCSCGMYKAHYETCPECGQEKITLLPNIHY